jgi:5-methyltetrahydrofolate--homocysteine methyltransferase
LARTTDDTTAELAGLAARRILVLDGAMGTALQAAELSAADFGGEELDGCNENLVFTRPDVVRNVHRTYLAAGADIVETNTFGGTPLVLAEYGLEDQAREINRIAAELARQEVDAARAVDGQPRFVAGSIGPTTRAITVTGGVSFDELVEHFRVQAAGLIDGGSDLLIVETQQDTRNVKAATVGIAQASEAAGVQLPLIISGTIEATGTMLAGQTAEAFVSSMAHLDLFAIGLNCATGPEFMTDSIRSMSPLARTRMGCVPNAGLPDEDGNYQESPEQIAAVLERFVDAGWLNLVGGCCGTTPAHIRALRDMVEAKQPRIWIDHRRSIYTGIDVVEVEEDNRPLLVGERTNVIGSRKFKRLIREEKFEEASEIARAQARGGAQILDVCLADPDREELQDMERFLDQVIRKIKMPLMLDSTDSAVLERALTWSQGKAIINSVNLEDGEGRFEEIAALAHRFGAALVVGCIDEDPDQGMAVTVERKLAVARRSHELLTGKYGLREEDLIFDPLVFPCATGDENYVGSARETIEGLRAIKEQFPRCRTVLGISNVSFGLPAAGREVLNSVFLYHCTRAGLDLAIVNSEKLERFASIPRAEVELADDLLFNRGDDPVAKFAAHFRGASGRVVVSREDLPLDERLARCVVEGSKEGLSADLDLKLAESEPLLIINGPLMAGMDEVGRLFNSNQLIVAEVLQSAEVMKAAVAHLEPHMPSGARAGKGRVILATVKGDVHDIGKNLVEIILSNNGYDVINLGIKVPPAALIEAVKEHAPDYIGLSGLLVKSAQQMVATANDLRENSVATPLLVGGAALSGRFTHTRIGPAYEAPTLYARAAMEGLALVERLRKEGPDAIVVEQRETHVRSGDAPRPEGAAVVVRLDPERIDHELAVPVVPDLGVHETEVDPDEAFALINPQMLFGKHMGYRQRFEKGLREKDPTLIKLIEQINRVKEECLDGAMKVRALWRWFPVEARGEEIVFFDAPRDGSEVGRLKFPRQTSGRGLCLSDYVLPPDAAGRDHIGLFVTTAGEGILEVSAAAREAGEYVRSHALQALAVETAEGAAEWTHRQMRAAWGFADPEELDLRALVRAEYRGKRYSFGYPACPDLESQRVLFDLLGPHRIGVQLTEGMMMEPEASVSALVFHHPQARYFSVEAGGDTA